MTSAKEIGATMMDDGHTESNIEPVGPMPTLVRLDTVRPRKMSWLWLNRIPLGKLTLIAGDPCLGKSFVTLDIAARVSCGTPWPDLQKELSPPGGVVLLSAEDDIEDTIVPRLKEAGADLSRITALNGIEWVNSADRERRERSFTLADVAALEQAILKTVGCRLVIIDPVSAYMPTGADSHRNTDVRSVLAPLASIASKYGVALLCVSHLSKGAGAAALYRVNGSLAYVAAARAAWLVTRDANDPNRRLMLPLKMNIARNPLGIAYSIIPAANDSEQGAVEWEDTPVVASADEALAALAPKPNRKAAPAREVAVDWLRDLLAQGPLPAEQVKKDATQAGITVATLRRAQNVLGVRPVKEGFDGGWVWRLPNEDAHQNAKALNP